MKTKTRYCYIDLIKVIAIFFVCMYHFWLGGNVAYSENMTNAVIFRRYCRGILSTCVPLFMMANGALVLNKPLLAQKHYRNLALLLFQFFIWRAITIVLLGLIQNVDFSSFSTFQLINVFLLLESVDGIKITHFWFVPLMFCIQLLLPFIKGVFDNLNKEKNSQTVLFTTLVFLFVINFVIYELNILRYLTPSTINLNSYYITSQLDPFSKRISMMLLYFLLGGLLHKYQENFLKLPAILFLAIIFISLTISFFEWRFMSQTLGYTYDNVFNGYSSVSTLACSISLFSLARKLESFICKSNIFTRILRYIGNNTLTIYYVHWIVGTAMFQYMKPYSSMFMNFTYSAFLMALGVSVGMLLKKIPILKHLAH